MSAEAGAETNVSQWPRVRVHLTRDALCVDLMALVDSMSPEDRLEFIRAVSFEERIFTGLCDAITNRHGWLWSDDGADWGWGNHTADRLRERLIPLMPEAAVHLIAEAREEVDRLKEDLELERRYSALLYEALAVEWGKHPTGERPALPSREKHKRPPIAEIMRRIRQHEEEAREAIAKAEATP